jgi:hypothetical protein
VRAIRAYLSQFIRIGYCDACRNAVFNGDPHLHIGHKLYHRRCAQYESRRRAKG